MRQYSQLSVALLLGTAACAAQSSSDTSEVAAAIEQPNGGLDTTDEAPQFGDEADFSAAGIEADSAATDTMASDPRITAIANAAGADVHQIVVLWGKLPADPSATDTRDWSGQLQLSRGAIVVDRKVAFEAATDSLLPRTAIDTVAFTSITGPASDGLALRILENAASTDPLTLTYTPNDGSAALVLDLTQLEAGPIVIDAGNGYKLVAIGEPSDPNCRGGFMRGRWHALTAHLGRFLGVVADRSGAVIGHVRGFYGERKNGDQDVFGKFIDLDGKFIGLLAGTYANGEYKARWIDRGGDHGAAHGVYFEAPTLRGGGFLGRWAEAACSEDAAPASP